MSRYLPLCSYIDSKLDFLPTGTGVFVSLAGVAGANYGLHRAFNVASDGMWVMPALAGFFLAGDTVEKHLPKLLNKASVGLTKGGVILRGSQVVAAGLPLAFSLALHLHAADGKTPEKDQGHHDQIGISQELHPY